MAITGTATVRHSDVALLRPVSIAVLIPCYNEAIAVGRVISAFRATLPNATIYVYDNNSTDDTIAIARNAGAIVSREPRQGKGNVVRRMFADIEADVYILVDGDDTYDAAAAPELVSALINDDLDFVNGARFNRSSQAYRFGHRFGNVVLTQMVRLIFGRDFTDMLSGYKILSRRFVKSFPAMSSGFETETEIVVHALELRMPCAELITAYGERPEGSSSKLRTIRDGIKILVFIARLIKNERPLQFFALVGALLILTAFFLGFPILLTYLETGLVPRVPTVILCAGLVIVGVISFFSALILDMTTRTRQELKRLAYLSFPKAGHRPL